MFSTRVGFYGGTAKQWYEYSNAEVLAEITNWRQQSNITVSSYNLGSTIINANDVYFAAVTHPNGNLYCAPSNGKTTILEINPTTLATREIATGISMSGTFRYLKGVVAQNGKIYWPPYGMNSVLIYDPATGVSSVQTWGLTMAGYFAIATANNKLYTVGNRADCLIIDLTANTASQTNFSGVITGTTSNKYISATRSIKKPNLLYFAGYDYQNILVIDINSNTAFTTNWGQAYGFRASQGIGNGKDGNLYISGHLVTNIWRIDPVANTMTRVSTSSIRGQGATLNDAGNIVIAHYPASPSDAQPQQYFNIPGNTVVSLSPSIQQRTLPVFATNGNTYILPRSTSNVHMLIYNFGGTSVHTSGMTSVVALSDYKGN